MCEAIAGAPGLSGLLLSPLCLPPGALQQLLYNRLPLSYGGPVARGETCSDPVPQVPSSVSQTHNPEAHETNRPSRPAAQEPEEPKEGRARFPRSMVGVSDTWSLQSQCPLHLSARKSVLSEDWALSPGGRNRVI